MKENIDELLDVYDEISINQIKSEVAFRTLVECVNENMYTIPEYQRKFRWSKQKIENLAISLIKGLPIPPIYTYRNKDNQLEILDGQQRIISLFLYFYGKIMGNESSPFFDYQDLNMGGEHTFIEALNSTNQLRDCKYMMNINESQYCISYSSLPKKIQRKVDYTPITVIEIKIESEENRNKILHKIFANLNREGEKLSDQELRNGIYPCKFFDMLYDMNRSNLKWRKIYGKVDRKGKDVEILLRLCAMRRYVNFSTESNSFVIDKFDNALLDNFSEMAIDFSSQECQEYKKSLENFFDRFDITRICKKATVLDSIYIVLEKTGIDCTITNDICDKIIHASGFPDASRQGTMSTTNMKRRWKIAYEQLSKYVK